MATVRRLPQHVIASHFNSPYNTMRLGRQPVRFSAPRILRQPLGPRATISTVNDSARRKSVTVINDTGRVPWKELSLGEKAARTTQQSFNIGLVALGVVLTAGVVYVLWLEVFSTDSKTSIFNQAANRVRQDTESVRLLVGEGLHSKREISAYGEPSWSRWARNRVIASRIEEDRAGIEHLRMHFYVEGPIAKGTVNLHMTKRPGENEFQWQLLALDVPGHQRHYLVNTDAITLDSRKQGKMFGVRWN